MHEKINVLPNAMEKYWLLKGKTYREIFLWNSFSLGVVIEQAHTYIRGPIYMCLRHWKYM